uniref:Uncharacterized protein n=1 Tax=Rhizophora mucronata TaxID=61149 RepID=A0A2P2N167_RHIMU
MAAPSWRMDLEMFHLPEERFSGHRRHGSSFSFHRLLPTPDKTTTTIIVS